MLNKINSSVYYMSHEDKRERPVLGLVCGERYSLVIDAGNSVQHAQDFLKEIEDLNVPPVKYVVITHGHWDHFLGSQEFGAMTIVNRLTNQIIQDWRSYSFDDESLQRYVDDRKISPQCMETIKNEVPERDSFEIPSPDIIFENALSIDLGNKVCVLETIHSTHTDDATIVYIPDDKVLFLGDSAYGTTTNSLFHYKQSLLMPMICDIRKYDAEYYVLGHESICDLAEINLYWAELISSSKATKSASLDEAIECFEKENGRAPNDNERFFLNAFVNDQILKSK
ncbi:MBL fold metallo-hydrolase [Jeotgalibacillus salarius]|uniref:MBL fold metallo-hydrolase n=1 Tax=Jeotgalibacillus salarius TaxID=546023 RepID=A0A4Y8LB87_9BACL|nr:MBL fold metallo-hydrolase [Jeotgalibacillus salarius]TFD99434.1 MBL fold metallo-hydrolase [Jeotgalibacillus salarius]